MTTLKNPGTLLIFTFKEGVLSRVAHDLRLRPQFWTLEQEGALVQASMPTKGFQVDGVVSADGSVDADALSHSQREEICQNIEQVVLHSGKYPTVRFSGRVQAASGSPLYRVEGDLELAGNRQAVTASIERQTGGDAHVGFEIAPSRWGVKPFSALLGAIRVQDRVRVEIWLPRASVDTLASELGT